MTHLMSDSMKVHKILEVQSTDFLQWGQIVHITNLYNQTGKLHTVCMNKMYHPTTD